MVVSIFPFTPAYTETTQHPLYTILLAVSLLYCITPAATSSTKKYSSRGFNVLAKYSTQSDAKAIMLLLSLSLSLSFYTLNA